MPKPTKRVSEWVLRKLFNEGDYWKKAQDGELTENIVKENHPSPALAFAPYCTRSQLISYNDEDGIKVAIVHQYLQPDGNLAASGKPDPKFLFHEGVRYHIKAPHS